MIGREMVPVNRQLLDHPMILTRADVRVTRAGWVEDKRPGMGESLIGHVWPDVNGAGQPIWRAGSSDVQSFSFTRGGAVMCVLALWNMHEKARAFDMVARAAARSVA